MKKLVVVFVLVVFAAAGFFAYNTFFSGGFSGAFSELSSLENKNGIGNGTILPATKAGLAEYRNGLLSLRHKWFSSKAFLELVEIKLSLTEGGEKIFFVGDEFAKINVLEPNCGPGGEIEALKKNALDAKKSFNSALSKRNEFVQNNQSAASYAPDVAGESFEQTISGINTSMDRIIEILDNQCIG